MTPPSGASEAWQDQTPWAELIPQEQWVLYQTVIERAQSLGIPFALAGGLAFSTYTRRWRNTKDMDLCIREADRETMVRILTESGFQDYFDQVPYDRSWIYRGVQGEVIVDLIWEMANHRAKVDDLWLTRGMEITIRGIPLRAIPAEELIWAKIYIVQKDRCDWPDLLNIIHTQGPHLRWEYLMERLGADVPLLGGLLCVFSWLCPNRAAELPGWLWQWLHLPHPSRGLACETEDERVRFLDSRPWFGPREAVKEKEEGHK